MRTNNKGISLIEILVVTAIIATLSGLLIPQFIKYISDKRATACVEHRDAIVSVCEKMVYGRQYPLDDLDGLVLNEINIGNLPASIPDEYKEDLKRHINCPEHGTMSITVSGGVIHCTCSLPDHEQEVSADLTTWAGTSTVTIDPSFTTPSGGIVPPIPDPPEDPEDPDIPEETPPSDPYNSSYWPYPEDPVWDTVVNNSDAHVYITVPSGKFPLRTAGGSTVVCVAIDKNGDHKLKVSKSASSDPTMLLCGGAAGGGSEAVIITNGLEYTSASLIEAASKNSTIYKDTGKGAEGSNKGKPDRDDQFWISGGTIYTCTTSGKRYIYFHQGQEWTDLPAENSTANQIGNWYFVGDTDQLH